MVHLGVPNDPWPASRGRWSNHLLVADRGFLEFWSSYLSHRTRDLLLIVGVSPDPHVSTCAEVLISAGGNGKRDCLALEISTTDVLASKQANADAPRKPPQLSRLLSGWNHVATVERAKWTEFVRATNARDVGSVFSGFAELSSYSDVVVDISALPQSVYFPLIDKLLHLVDAARNDEPSGLLNLHVCVAEDPSPDINVMERDIDEMARYLPGFEGGPSQNETVDLPKVWIPILEEGQRMQLERIHEYVKPDEVCPALPFPARNPRRGDDLVLEYHDLLFDKFRVNTQSILYLAEGNPFDAYRQMRKAVLNYQNALRPLGGCRCIVSVPTSRSPSMGALLLAYELRSDVAVIHVSTQMPSFSSAGETVPRANVSSLWLTGECYDL